MNAQTQTALIAAIAARNPSAPRDVVEAAARLAATRNVTVGDIQGDDGETLVGGLTDEAHNSLTDAELRVIEQG